MPNSIWKKRCQEPLFSAAWGDFDCAGGEHERHDQSCECTRRQRDRAGSGPVPEPSPWSLAPRPAALGAEARPFLPCLSHFESAHGPNLPDSGTKWAGGQFSPPESAHSFGSQRVGERSSLIAGEGGPSASAGFLRRTQRATYPLPNKSSAIWSQGASRAVFCESGPGARNFLGENPKEGVDGLRRM